MSGLLWLDYSEDDRRRMMDVIRLFRDKTTRDELGIGTIRDGFSDIFFPGISTIHTRARYFLFIPWIYLSLERQPISSKKLQERSRYREFNLRDALMKSDDTDGLIGKVSGRKLQRLPSSVYWSGLERWGIRKIEVSQWQYKKSLDSFRHANRKIQSEIEDNESLFSNIAFSHIAL